MSNQHKSAIATGGFYEELSGLLQSPPEQENISVESLVLQSTFKDLATPSWLESVVNINIDNFVSWITDQSPVWNIYLPTEDIQSNVSKNIDGQVDQALDDSNTKIRPCDASQSQDIRSTGLSLEGDFCLPPSVISGEQTLTEYMGIQDSSLSKDFFNSLLTQNPLTSDNLSLNKLYPSSSVVGTLDSLRTLYIWLVGNLVFVWIVFLAFILGHLFISKATEKSYLGQIQKILTLTGINTIILSLVIILFVAGSNYLTSSVVKFILPGLEINQIQNIILFKVVLVIAGLLQVAIAVSILFLVIRFAISVLINMNIIGSVKDKNKRLNSKQTNLLKNPTHDGEFLRKVVTSDNDVLESPVLSQINHIKLSNQQTYSEETQMPVDSKLMNESILSASPEQQQSEESEQVQDPYDGYNPFNIPKVVNNKDDKHENNNQSQTIDNKQITPKPRQPVLLNVSSLDQSTSTSQVNSEDTIIDPAQSANSDYNSAKNSFMDLSTGIKLSQQGVSQKGVNNDLKPKSSIKINFEKQTKPTVTDTGSAPKMRGL